MIRLNLSKKEIDTALARKGRSQWVKLLDAYAFLLRNIKHSDAPALAADYERTFNYFYQVRRNEEWRRKFYALFSEHAKRGTTDFAEVLGRLFDATGQVEMSFASKFTATIDTDLPVIDRHVLSFIDRRPPPLSWPAEKRIEGIIGLHAEMKEGFEKFLKGPPGNYLIECFIDVYGGGVSEMKMLDMVLWRSGGKKK